MKLSVKPVKTWKWGNTPEPGPSGEELTTQELLKDLSEENWADTATTTPDPVSPEGSGIAIGR